MMHHDWRKMYWKSNLEPMMGFGPGELTCVDTRPGGGFAGAPEVLVMAKTSGLSGGPVPEPVEFPPPSTGVEYRIGGHGFEGYNYYDVKKTLSPHDAIRRAVTEAEIEKAKARLKAAIEADETVATRRQS